jgi:hypothetical protein
MNEHPLDFNTRKSLCVHLGEGAGQEISDLIMRMAERISALERGKVDVTPIISRAAKLVRLSADELA